MSPDTLAPDVMRPLLRGRFGDPYLYEPECASTQELLRGTSLPEGAIAVTEHQTAGRGRLGRTWEDSPGAALLVSVLLRPPAPADAPQLSLVCALAVAEAVESATVLSAQLKWPNDVMLDRRKVAGILLEGSGTDPQRDRTLLGEPPGSPRPPPQLRFAERPLRGRGSVPPPEGSPPLGVICGIGVNVNQTREQLPAKARIAAGSLRTVTGREHDRAALLADVLAQLERHYDAWRGDGLPPLHAGIGARNFLFGRRLRMDGRSGTGGTIAVDGRLEVMLDGGEAVLAESGEIEVDR